MTPHQFSGREQMSVFYDKRAFEQQQLQPRKRWARRQRSCRGRPCRLVYACNNIAAGQLQSAVLNVRAIKAIVRPPASQRTKVDEASKGKDKQKSETAKCLACMLLSTVCDDNVPVEAKSRKVLHEAPPQIFPMVNRETPL